MVRLGDVMSGGAPPRPTPDRPDPDGLAIQLANQVAELRVELTQAQAGRMAEHGRAERAEAESQAERRRADEAEARSKVEADRRALLEEELRMSRKPLWERVIRAVRGP